MMELRKACHLSREVAIRDKKKFDEQRRSSIEIKKRWTYYQTEKEKVENNGMKRLHRLLDLLSRCDQIGLCRSHQQRQMHMEFIASSLKKILKEDYTHDITKVCQRYNFRDLRQDIVILTPRRFGKTTGVAIYVSCYILSQPGCCVSIYSTGRRASKKILALIYKIVSMLCDDDQNRIPTYNQECLEVITDGKRSECWSYPSRVQVGCSPFFWWASCSL